MSNAYLILPHTVAVADPKMNNETVKKLWQGFCLTLGALTLQEGEPFTFSMGNAPLPTLPEGKEYALTVTPTGAALRGKDYGGLMRPCI